MKAILITEPIAKESLAKITELGYAIKNEYDEAGAEIANEDVVGVINRLHAIDGPWMDQYPNLKIIAYHGVGYDAIDLDAARERNICVAITPGQNARSVAEHTIALMLGLAKNTVALANGYRESGFGIKYNYECTELYGKTLGLFGLGTIGSIVAQIAKHGFGMSVIAYDPYLKNAPEDITLVASKSDILAQADYISLHLNLTDETRNYLSTEEFRQMKPTARLINVSRGPMVDELALIQALQNHEIAGAGLDVTDPEECAADNPLMQMNQVILSPHVAGSATEALIRVADMCIANIDCHLNGQPLPGRIVS